MNRGLQTNWIFFAQTKNHFKSISYKIKSGVALLIINTVSPLTAALTTVQNMMTVRFQPDAKQPENVNDLTE